MKFYFVLFAVVTLNTKGADIIVDPTLGDPVQFSSVFAKGSIGDSSDGPVDMVEFEASGGSMAAQKIADLFNRAKKIAVSSPPDDRHKFSSLLFKIVLTSPTSKIDIVCCSHQLILVTSNKKRQWYWLEDPFSDEGFVPQFSVLLFVKRDKVDLKVRELKRDKNEFGPPRKSMQGK